MAKKDTPIARRIKSAREAKGITIYRLSIEVFGKMSSRVYKYEQAEREPSYDTISRIAKYFKLPTSYFYTKSDKEAFQILKKYIK